MPTGAALNHASSGQDTLFPTTAAADASSGRALFALALAAYAAIDMWVLRWIPVGSDTADYWHMFYTSYTEVFFSNRLALWLPYGGYGQSNLLYHVMEISSCDYLMMIVGKLLRVTNAMLMFQLSLVADHLLFLFGIYSLSRMLFGRRSSVALCTIGSLVVLHAQQLGYLHVFRVLSWYPLIVYFLARFFQEARPEMLWIAGGVFTSWCLGAIYLPIYMILALAPFVAVATWKHPRAWRSVVSLSARNVVPMAICLGTVALYFYVSRAAFDGIVVTKDGRASSAIVDVASFLPIYDQSMFAAFISLASGGVYYIGLLPIVCIVLGLFGVRSPLFYSFMASALLLTWFALGGLLSLSLFYYAPLVSRTHYLWMGYYLMRAPMLLAAAAAWDVFAPSRKNLKILFLAPVVIVFLLDVSLQGDRYVLVNAAASSFSKLWRPVYDRLVIYGAFVGAALIAHYAVRRRSSSAPFVVVALLAGLFVDVFGYSYQSGLPENKIAASYRSPATVTWLPADTSSPYYQVGRVQRLRWQAERLDEPTQIRQQVALTNPSYYHTDAFAQFDPCEPKIAPTILNTSIAKLLALRDKGDGALRAILGCHVLKMRLVTSALYVADEKAAAVAVQRATDLVGTAIVELPQNHLPLPVSVASAIAQPGAVELTAFSSNTLAATVHVDNPDGAWLVYADAYDPRWHAWVNDRPTPIVPAYVGLKALRVPHGDSLVRMEFSGVSTIAMTVLAFAGAMCSLSLLVYCVTRCIAGFPLHGGG